MQLCFFFFFCMLMIPWVWTDCLFRSFQICSLYVLLVFKRSALMLTNCIHRYVLFIARLKGIYTYYEKEKKSVQISYPVNMEVHCLRLLQTDTRHCSMTMYIDLTRMKNHTHSWFTDLFSITSSVAQLSDLFIYVLIAHVLLSIGSVMFIFFLHTHKNIPFIM